MANSVQFFILTGNPGVGKTTMVKELCSFMNENSIKTKGFYTEEIKKNRVREGFDVVTLDGNRGRLARVQDSLKPPMKHQVGKYGVLLQEFETVALPSLNKPDDIQTCLVIDEIGKMECFSQLFRNRIKEIFSPNSNYIVLATVPVRSRDTLIESIKNNFKARVWTIVPENRTNIRETVFQEIINVFINK